MYYLCEKYYKPVIVQYYVTNYVLLPIFRTAKGKK